MSALFQESSMAALVDIAAKSKEKKANGVAAYAASLLRRPSARHRATGLGETAADMPVRSEYVAGRYGLEDLHDEGRKIPSNHNTISQLPHTR
jgi:hypothetical protein